MMMKYEEEDEVVHKETGREGIEIRSPHLSDAKKNTLRAFHDLRAVRWDDTDTIGWINRNLLEIKD